MADRCLPVLCICNVRRNDTLDVNTLREARKLLKSIEGSVGRGNIAIMDDKGAP